MSEKALRESARSGESDDEDQSGVRHKPDAHEPSVWVSRKLLEELPLAEEEEAAWEALRGRLLALGHDPYG